MAWAYNEKMLPFHVPSILHGALEEVGSFSPPYEKNSCNE
jgi:hypothetical protein